MSYGAIERHVRNSHAIGKLVVDSVVHRLGSLVRTAPRPRPDDVATGDESRVVRDATTGSRLPFAEGEYVSLTSGDVVELISRSDDDTVRAIGDFESQHRRRRLVLEAVARRVGA